MMKSVILVACFALAYGAVRREAPAAATPLQELERNAQEFSKTFGEQISTLTNSKNTQEFNKALKEGSDAVLQQLSAFSSSLQGALGDANGKAKEALEQARAGLQRSADELRRAHPDVEQRAAKLRDQIQAAVQNAAQEAQKLAKEVSANIEQTAEQKLAPQIKKAYEDFVKQAEAVQKQLHDAANKQ